MHGLMSGDGKRGAGHRPQATAPILDSTLFPVAAFRQGRSGLKADVLAGTLRSMRPMFKVPTTQPADVGQVYRLSDDKSSNVLTIDTKASMNSWRCLLGNAARTRSSTRLPSGSAARNTRRPSSVIFTA